MQNVGYSIADYAAKATKSPVYTPKKRKVNDDKITNFLHVCFPCSELGVNGQGPIDPNVQLTFDKVVVELGRDGARVKEHVSGSLCISVRWMGEVDGARVGEGVNPRICPRGEIQVGFIARPHDRGIYFPLKSYSPLSFK